MRSRGLAVIEAAAEERRIDAIRRDFVATVSHELKTPVGAIALLAETLATEWAVGQSDALFSIDRELGEENWTVEFKKG